MPAITFNWSLLFEAAAGGGSERRSGQEQLADVFEAGEMLQFLRVEDRAGEVDAGDLEGALRQFGERRDRLAVAVQHDAAMLADGPFGGVAVGGKGRATRIEGERVRYQRVSWHVLQPLAAWVFT